VTSDGGVGALAARRARDATLLCEAEQLAAPHQPPAHPRPVVLLPANHRALTPVPPAAREAFRRHLRLQLTRAFAEPLEQRAPAMAADTDDPEGPAADSADLAVGPMLSAACGTCGGACCMAGGTHAFLKAASLVRVRRDLASDGMPAPSAAEIEARYLDALPAAHYHDSCVFHAFAGCTLPRTLRSNLCNRYLCGGLTQLARTTVARSEHAAFVAAVDDGGRLVRLALVTPAGAQPITAAGSSCVQRPVLRL
jgi:hypothetical protein